MHRRAALVALPALTLTRALHAQEHWLLGTWTGELVGGRSSETGRTLRVTAVDPAGATATGQWGRNEPTTIRLSGNTLRFVTGENIPVELTRNAAGTLEGTIQQSNQGRQPPYTITMTKRR